MISVLLIKIAGIVLTVIKSLDWLYFFQTKEYRLDRVFSAIKEFGFLNLLLSSKIHAPAKSLRNFLIVFFAICTTVFLFFLTPKEILFLLLFFFPLISFLLTLVLTLFSSIPVFLYRQTIIVKAQKKLKKSTAVFIGITGSYGKTSVKEFLYTLLSEKFIVGKTEGNQNTQLGIALSILKNLKPNTEFFIAEIGAYKKGEIKLVCQMLKPKYAILTGIGNQHLSLFGSKSNLLAAKKELFLSLDREGIAYLDSRIKEKKFFLKNLQCQVKEIPTFAYKNTLVAAGARLVGKHNLQNLALCLAIAKDLGLSAAELRRGVKKLKPLQNRLEVKQGVNGSILLDDSYSSNVNGFLAAIKATKSFPHKLKIVINKGVLELGEEKELSYKKILAELKSSSLQLYTTDRLFKKLDKAGVVSFFADEEGLLKQLNKTINKNTLIVIEGRFSPRILNYLRLE